MSILIGLAHEADFNAASRAKPAGTFRTEPSAKDASADEYRELMEDNQIRRVLVTDANGCCCGIPSQADFANEAQGLAGEIVHAISRPSDTASNVLH
ncbi:hypothetical protein [Pseudomonas sp. TCU-HL1]|uniref:hypothetical protein n=1 Tax=Pseudomonas sp. TCU-HL1 TaxID=1856685 RepID=UPI00083D6A31|nr:hypothetical protein [Pseudomonas sp. TCU-HL1]AOE84244.1 hypothetical protein THL1_1696 [Pseudomonas sp. TCU-HL1]